MSGTSDWALRVTRKASACIKLRTDASWRTIIAYLVQCTKLKPVELEAPGLDSLGMRAPTLNLADLPRYSTEGLLLGQSDFLLSTNERTRRQQSMRHRWRS